MYSVGWIESAVNNIANAWTQSDSKRRADITAASHRIDQVLSSNPLGAGESRDEDRRIYIDLPVVTVYEIDHDHRRVTVVEAFVSRRSRGDSSRE